MNAHEESIHDLVNKNDEDKEEREACLKIVAELERIYFEKYKTLNMIQTRIKQKLYEGTIYIRDSDSIDEDFYKTKNISILLESENITKEEYENDKRYQYLSNIIKMIISSHYFEEYYLMEELRIGIDKIINKSQHYDDDEETSKKIGESILNLIKESK